MKNFIDICKMSEKEVKQYMHKYLSSYKYKVVNQDGFLYAKGDVPVLLVAHMDTVHKELVKDVVEKDGKISSPQGIGGDDRSGIFMLMNIVNELHCSVLLCEKEEVGGIGAKKFTQSNVAKEVDVNYIIEFDRKGNNDAVFYNCDNKDFTKFICDNGGFKEAYGSFSDISVVAPALGIAAVNLSCGYYNAHTKDEYVVYSEMMLAMNKAKKIIETECEQFEYVEKKYSYNYGNYGGGWDWGEYNNCRQYSFYNDTKLSRKVKKDLKVELEVVYIGMDNQEEIAYSEGDTKAEAWLNFFMDNPDVSFGMIEDYSFN